MHNLCHSLGLLFFVGVAAACGGNGTVEPPPPPPPCPTNAFCVPRKINAFNPMTLSVAAGSTVLWRNDSGVLHNVDFADPSVAGAVDGGPAGNIPSHQSGTHSRVFSVAGTHHFECTIHFGMVGSVSVQ